MLNEFIKANDRLSDYAECIGYYWEKRTNVSTVRSQLSQYLTDFKQIPGFGCISHLLFLQFLDDQKIVKMSDKEREQCAKTEMISWIVGAATLDRLGRHSAVRGMRVELIRHLAHML